MTCIKCKKKNVDTFMCDCCKEQWCLDCTDLSSSEVKVLELKKKRIMKFYCIKCDESIKKYMSQKRELGAPEVTEQIKPQTLLKCFTEEMIKEMKNGMKEMLTELKETNVLLVDDTNNIIKKCVQDLNKIEIGISENKGLLKTVNTEVSTLKKKVNHCKIIENEPATSYSDALKNTGIKNAAILVKPSVVQNSIKTKNDIKNKIDPKKLAVGIDEMKSIRAGGVIINCVNADSKKKIKESMAQLGDKYKVEDAKLKNPHVIIIGVEEETINLENESIIAAMIEQNELIKTDESIRNKIRIVNKYIKKSMKNSGNIVLEVEPSCNENLVNLDKINIGWRRCNIYQYYHIPRCYKCARFYHLARDCPNEITCEKCSGNHVTKMCSSENLKCINCVTTSQKLKIKIDVNHATYDRNCACYKKALETEMKKMKVSNESPA